MQKHFGRYKVVCPVIFSNFPLFNVLFAFTLLSWDMLYSFVPQKCQPGIYKELCGKPNFLISAYAVADLLVKSRAVTTLTSVQSQEPTTQPHPSAARSCTYSQLSFIAIVFTSMLHVFFLITSVSAKVTVMQPSKIHSEQRYRLFLLLNCIVEVCDEQVKVLCLVLMVRDYSRKNQV